MHVDEFGEELRTNGSVSLAVPRRGPSASPATYGRNASACSEHAGGRHTNRPELVELYGFDTKYAMHMVRLGVQGVELLETGRISLPIAEPWLSWLRDLRQGLHTLDEALAAATELEARLDELDRTSPLPAHPDREAADRWLVDVYERAWASTRGAPCC